jgi:hypothetical protein
MIEVIRVLYSLASGQMFNFLAFVCEKKSDED